MKNVAATPKLDLTVTPTPAPVSSTAPVPAVTPAVQVPAVEQAADFRLVIEEDPDSGSFVYKTLDRRTGEVVNQFPREQMLRLKDSENYTPGRVFNGQS
jgi:flagellar protein FlaG